VHSRPEAESRESPRESEKKIQGPKKSESQSKLKMRREIGDGASCFKGLGHDFAPTAEAVVNQPLDCKRCSRRFEPNKQHLRDEAAPMCRRGKVAPLPSDAAFHRPAPMSPSTQNAPNVSECLAPSGRAAPRHEGSVPTKTVYLVHAATVTLVLTPRQSHRTRLLEISGAHPERNARTAPRTRRPIHPI
jgi:hypothetical protein